MGTLSCLELYILQLLWPIVQDPFLFFHGFVLFFMFYSCFFFVFVFGRIFYTGYFSQGARESANKRSTVQSPANTVSPTLQVQVLRWRTLWEPCLNPRSTLVWGSKPVIQGTNGSAEIGLKWKAVHGVCNCQHGSYPIYDTHIYSALNTPTNTPVTRQGSR